MKIKDIVPVYLRYLRTTGRSSYTIKDAKYTLRRLIRFIEAEGVHDLEDLTQEPLEAYQQELAFCLTAKGKLLAIRTQTKRLGTIKGFTRFLKEADYLAHDPGQRLRLPKEPKVLPKVILDLGEVRKILAAPDTRTNRGYRNRVILEILYDTGIRRAEVRNIKLSDLDLDAGYIRIHGKGDKERVVPVSERVCTLIRNYNLSIRPHFVNGDDSGYLFLNRWGRKMDPNAVWAVVKRCARLARIKKNVTTHTFRHTCATHMLKNGAPVRHIQEMLGHESLESTQVYTRVTINDLKEVHSKYHPGAS